MLALFWNLVGVPKYGETKIKSSENSSPNSFKTSECKIQGHALFKIIIIVIIES